MDKKNGKTETENPLDNRAENGGFCAIFRYVTVIGDSLASGELDGGDGEYKFSGGEHYDYSWPSFFARRTGCTVYNFSRGGMSAREFISSYAGKRDFYNPKYRSRAYIIALGVNDLLVQNQEFGTFEDIDFSDPERNKSTFSGSYAAIIQKIKGIQPSAKIFLVTMPKAEGGYDTPENERKKLKHRDFLNRLCHVFPDTYLIDFYRYAPVYDEEFKRKFYLHSHLNPCGYLLTSQMTENYIDYIIKTNFEAFRYIGFIPCGDENEER